MDVSTIIAAAESILLGGGLVTLVTLKQIRKKAQIENEGSSVEVLKQVVTELKEESGTRKEEREQYRADLEAERFKNDDLREENTAIKMMMCVHMGCNLRKPLMGQGDNWYQEHKEDPGLGCDYLPINQLLRKMGADKKAADGNDK